MLSGGRSPHLELTLVGLHKASVRLWPMYHLAKQFDDAVAGTSLQPCQPFYAAITLCLGANFRL